jgi:uncharacterized protein
MTVLLLTAVYITASFVQGVTGFGFGLLSVPLVSLLFSPAEAVGMNAIVGTTNCVYAFILLRKLVKYRQTTILFLLSAAFVPLGAYFLIRVNQHIVLTIMGMMVVAVTLREFNPNRRNDSPIFHSRFSLVFPALAGLLGGAFTAPGSAIVPYMFARESDPHVARANLQYFFTLISGLVIASHLWTGNLNQQNALRALPFVPIVFLFTKLGSVTAFRIHRDIFRRIVNSALLFFGFYLIIKNGIVHQF